MYINHLSYFTFFSSPVFGVLWEWTLDKKGESFPVLDVKTVVRDQSAQVPVNSKPLAILSDLFQSLELVGESLRLSL